MRIGYAAALEQLAPREAVDLAALAEQNGFEGTMATDHFQPWVPTQGQASFVWNVLAAIAEHTSGDLGPGVTTPSFRWHPAVVAQAAATLAAMNPGRVWLGIGSGEAISEHVVGGYWPEPAERIARMFEAVEIISKLFTASLGGKDAKHSGEHFRLESTRLWTMPATAPPILIATAGPVTARRAGRVADGLITQGADLGKVEHLLERFRLGAREAGKDPGSLATAVRLDISWAPTQIEALENAVRHWPNGAMRFPKSDLRSPFDFAQLAKVIRPEDFTDRVLVSADPAVHRAHIQRYLDMGFDRIYLHNVGPNQVPWLERFGADVLPGLVG